jgi:AcrR family transcriptional regulator
LVEGARKSLLERGVEGTTIADIASVADVPVGNVYYYFKTKDELVEAAIEAHAAEMRARLAELERHRRPEARLKALARLWADQADVVARYGCPQGTLCQELHKREDGLDRKAAVLLETSVDWAEQQFAMMGRRDARELAVELVARIQGTSLLTHTFRDAGIMVRHARRTEHWIDSLR